MDFKQIQELVRLVGKNNISELSIEEDNFKIKIKTISGSPVLVEAPKIYQSPTVQAPATVSAPATETPKTTAKTDEGNISANAENENFIVLKSPIVGTFYRSSGPDKEPFVKTGDDITVGTVICVIEAMKLFNEIESEFNGTIVKILVDDASPVEFDQPLFLINPK